MSLKHAALVSAVLALFACASVRSEPSLFTPDDLDEIEAAMHALVDDGYAPGVVTIVLEDGVRVFEDAYGVANADTGAQIATDTVMRIASMTKPITGVALMILYEEGRWSLDDPIAAHVPEFADLMVRTESGALISPDHAPTMRELVSHTAGFSYGIVPNHPVDQAFIEAGVLDGDSSLEAMIAKLADIPLKHQPGEVWEYSVGADIQGAIVQRLSGQLFDVFLRERVFAPLGMNDTGFAVPAHALDRIGVLHVTDEDGRFAAAPELGLGGQLSDDPTVAPGLLSGGGGLFSTPDDYARFAQMLANGGALDGARILAPETVALMRSNMLPEGVRVPIVVPNATFGIDLAIWPDPSESGLPIPEGSYSWPGIFGVYDWIDPENDLVVLAMTQLTPSFVPGRISAERAAAEAIYGAIGE